ncbi:adenylyl-sulfate kinase [Candidatus Cloacimonadota bacterium]
MRSSNTLKQKGKITRSDREKLLKQKGVLIWLTGLSGSGKSTIAYALEAELISKGHPCFVLDGDNVRQGLNGDLEFSQSDRKENIRRIGEVGKLFVDAGLITITSFISPFIKDRDSVRNKLETGQFIEVYVKCSLEVCEKRDVKGLYKKARAGEIADFTGISSPFEEPENSELIVESDKLSAEESVEQIFQYLKLNKILED